MLVVFLNKFMLLTRLSLKHLKVNYFLWSYGENICGLTSQITRKLIRDREIWGKYGYSLKYIIGNQPKINNWWGNDFLDSYDKFDYTTDTCSLYRIRRFLRRNFWKNSQTPTKVLLKRRKSSCNKAWYIPFTRD